MVAAALVDAEALRQHGRVLVPRGGDPAVDSPAAGLHPHEGLHVAALECKRLADGDLLEESALLCVFAGLASAASCESATKRTETTTKRPRSRPTAPGRSVCTMRFR